VLHRPLAALAALVAALVFVPAALAAAVHVRVEGKTQTIFGPAQPVVSGTNALDVLEAAATRGEFYYHVQQASFGNYVDQIGLYPAGGQAGWVFKVNGVSPPVGADQVQLADGDVVLWYWAEFGPSGGPPTLLLQRASRRCYTVRAQDDQGRKSVPSGAAIHVAGRSVAAPKGRACLKPHSGLVWATAPGAVRSNRLP
jgi:Domain of unknown function (DUF4430)